MCPRNVVIWLSGQLAVATVLLQRWSMQLGRHILMIKEMLLQGEKRQFGEEGQPTKVALQIYETLTALQQLKTEDPFGWVVPVV